MAAAKSGDTVRVHYTGRLADGTVFDSSEGREPLEFTLGEQQVISGFDRAVSGMQVGESVTVTIPVDDAYGRHRDNLVIQVDQSQFPADIKPELGLSLRMQQPDGSTVRVRITALEAGKVTLDANHPLAGEDLVFDIELVEILAA
ncbi:MAG: peptidylprolyl isomerase [candidate division Zixibacteria bacterium]|nr:peptidylprolyl isomerase [candidate division Zixibacteria bacterium]